MYIHIHICKSIYMYMYMYILRLQRPLVRSSTPLPRIRCELYLKSHVILFDVKGLVRFKAKPIPHEIRR